MNYDHPDSFDTALMIAHLQELRAGHPVQVPVYDYTIHNRSNQTVLVQPAPVIIVEGILIFDSPELCELMDMKVFVDTDADCASCAASSAMSRSAGARWTALSTST